MKREKKIAIAVVATFSALSVIVLFHSISPYTTPSDLVNAKERMNVQVVGKIVKVSRLDGTTVFTLSDGKTEIRCLYNGTISAAYENQEVVVVGNWKNGELIANEILKKCHTEYTG